MADKKCEVEVTLVELSLLKTLRSAEQSLHLLGTELVWPRVGTACKTFSASLKLATGCWLMENRPWTQRILFKETVQGRFGFEVTLTEGLSEANAAAFMRYMASQVTKLTTTAAKKMLTPPLLGSLADIPFSYLVKELLKEQAPAMLASGVRDLDAGQLPAVGRSARWEVPLLAPDGIHRTVHTRVGKTTQRRRETLVPPGGNAGRCIVEVLVL